MSMLLNCGICCFLLSIWGIIQLTFMGVFFYIESIVLLEDVEAEEYEDYDHFITLTKGNFSKAALNCWVAAGIYIGALGISYSCIIRARAHEEVRALKLEDDEVVCGPNIDTK